MMAASSTHPGDFILAIGETGKSLMTSYTKFITYRKVHDRRLENLYATLSLTTNTLLELGTTVNKYEHEFRIKDEVIHPICETAKVNLEKLLVMITEAISEGVWKKDGTIGGQSITAEIDPWYLITMGLGGREEAKAYWKSLDDTRDTLIELNDIVKYRILKDLSDKNKLSPAEAKEYKDLVALLPHLLHSVEKAEKGKKIIAELLAKKEKADAERKKAMDMPNFMRRNSDAASDMTLVIEPEVKQRRSPVKDFDCESISSVSSSTSTSSSDSGMFIDAPELYEEWTFKWFAPSRNVNRSWGFLGLKFKTFYEDTGYWEVQSEYRTQDEMKEQHHFAAADLSPSKHKEAMQKIIQAVPKKLGYEVDFLIEDRNEASSHEEAKRQWSVVSVRPQQKFPYGSAKKWGKDPLYTNWVVTIRGETVDTNERSRSYRREDPWLKRDLSPYRSQSPPRRRSRNHYPIIREHPIGPAPIPMPRPPYRPVINRGPPGPPPPPMIRRDPAAIPDEGFRQGTLVVGKILSTEEAIKKMDEVWEQMTTKVEKAAVSVEEASN